MLGSRRVGVSVDGGSPDILPQGLSEQDAAARLNAEGPNTLPQADRRTFGRIILEILREPMFALLLGAAAIYLVLGDLREAVVLAVFASTSVLIAVVQESRTERVLESLRDLTSPRALVIREGAQRRIAGAEVVRGDLVILAEGDRVPADATVLSAHDLECDESLLTGEAVPVRKIAAPEAAPSGRPGGDDLPYVYSGSLVVRGHGRAKVTATGVRSEIGKIGLAITRIDTEPPRLRIQTRRLVRNFAAVSLSLSALAVLLYGLWRGGWLDALLSGIALGMSMLPEEFPLVLTVFMVMGAWRISRARVLTRRVAAIETLGAATVLCTDKTGTLTQNRMTIVALRAGDDLWRQDDAGQIEARLATIIERGILASAREPFDPMEKAFHAFGTEHFPADHQPYRGRALKWEYGLRPDLLAVTNVWEQAGSKELIVAAKGAPETIAELCDLSEAEIARLRVTVDEMAREGMRVLGVARASVPANIARPETPRGFPFAFLGLVGIADPLRPTVPAAVQECRTAGIRVLMITGDYPQTARAIATQANLEADDIVTGSDLERMSDEDLAQRVRSATIFARTMPEQKLRIVNALKANGEVVAMTGDGVNDAPSLKTAHIGIAMGGRGTDVAREAASLILLDDDFTSIVTAIRLGRRIYDNLRKAMAYILAVHVPIAGLALIPLLFGLPLVFWPLHIAFLEMVIDPVCSIVFEAEAEEADTMRRPPRHPSEPLFNAGFVAWSLLQGALVLALVASLFVMALRQGLPEPDARSLAFAALIATNLGLVLVNRSLGASIFAALARPNAALWWVVAATAAILGGVILFPPARELFHFGPLHGDDIAVALASGLAGLFLLELAKKLVYPSLTARFSVNGDRQPVNQ
jgi:P-type Ca2+ transporter type 2C